MNARLTLGLAAVLGFVLVSAAAAQGLGDTAARERAKRVQNKKPEAKVFTNDDLDAGRPPEQKTEGGAAPAQPASTSEPEVLQPVRDDSGDERRQQELAYVEAVRSAEAEVAGVESRVRELSGKLNPMSTTFIYGAGGSNDANEEQRVRAELQEAEQQLIAARQGVVTANKNLQDFRQGRPIEEPR